MTDMEHFSVIQVSSCKQERLGSQRYFKKLNALTFMRGVTSVSEVQREISMKCARNFQGKKSGKKVGKNMNTKTTEASLTSCQ